MARMHGGGVWLVFGRLTLAARQTLSPKNVPLEPDVVFRSTRPSMANLLFPTIRPLDYDSRPTLPRECQRFLGTSFEPCQPAQKLTCTPWQGVHGIDLAVSRGRDYDPARFALDRTLAPRGA